MKPKSDLIGEPLLDDRRLSKIEERLRQEFPALPEAVSFASWVQPAMWATSTSNIEVHLPDTAVLAILATNPKHPELVRIFKLGDSLERWQAREWFTRHDSEMTNDPAYRAYRTLVPQVIEWVENLRALLN